VISLQSTVSLPSPAVSSRANTQLGNRAEEVFWLRVLTPDNQWRMQYPKIWQLLNEFDICVVERLRQASLIGTKDYVLVTRTSCSNGFRVITGHCYLSPPFSQMDEMELYLGEHLVDLLHIHFFGDPEVEQTIAIG
jgi:hypothetical protein